MHNYDPVSQIWLCGSKHDTPIKEWKKRLSPPFDIFYAGNTSALFSLFSISTSFSSFTFPLRFPLLRTHSRSKDIRGFCFLLHHLKELSISVCPSHWLKATVKLRGGYEGNLHILPSGLTLNMSTEIF